MSRPPPRTHIAGLYNSYRPGRIPSAPSRAPAHYASTAAWATRTNPRRVERGALDCAGTWPRHFLATIALHAGRMTLHEIRPHLIVAPIIRPTGRVIIRLAWPGNVTVVMGQIGVVVTTLVAFAARGRMGNERKGRTNQQGEQGKHRSPTQDTFKPNQGGFHRVLFGGNQRYCSRPSKCPRRSRKVNAYTQAVLHT